MLPLFCMHESSLQEISAYHGYTISTLSRRAKQVWLRLGPPVLRRQRQGGWVAGLRDASASLLPRAVQREPPRRAAPSLLLPPVPRAGSWACRWAGCPGRPLTASRLPKGPRCARQRPPRRASGRRRTSSWAGRSSRAARRRGGGHGQSSRRSGRTGSQPSAAARQQRPHRPRTSRQWQQQHRQPRVCLPGLHQQQHHPHQHLAMELPGRGMGTTRRLPSAAGGPASQLRS